MSSREENSFVNKNKQNFIWFGILMILMGGLVIFSFYSPYLFNITDDIILYWSSFGLTSVEVLILGIMVFVNKKLVQNIDDQYYVDFYDILRIMFFTQLIVIVITFRAGWEIEFLALILKILDISLLVIMSPVSNYKLSLLIISDITNF